MKKLAAGPLTLLSRSPYFDTDGARSNAQQAPGRRTLAWSLYAALMALGVFASMAAGRGHLGLHPLSYDYAHQALLAASGEWVTAFTIYHRWPPGYAAVLATFISLGAPPLRAEWILSVGAFAGVVTLTFVLARRLTTTAGGVIGAVLITFNIAMLRWANMGMSEMLFTLSILAAILMFDVFSVSASDGALARRFGLVVAAGVLLALPFWIRYIGLVVTFVGIVCAALLFISRPSARAAVATLLGTVLLIVGLLPLRNLLASGGLTGHEVGVQAANTFVSAMEQALRELCAAWVWHAVHSRPLVVWVTGVVVLVALAFPGLRRFRYAFTSWMPLAYVATLSIAASRTRIDTISDRYLVPILPLVVISVLVVAYTWRAMPWWRNRSWRCAGAGVGGIVFAVAAFAVWGGLERVVAGYAPPTANYSAETLEYIRRQIPKGTTVAGNRFGEQLCATTLDYECVDIPFNDPFNADYPKAYGVQLWSRDDALKVFREHDVRYVVFFLGAAAKDPFLEVGAYGEYVDSIVKGTLPEIRDVTKLKDGILISLQETGT
jgi:hypothetical protein